MEMFALFRNADHIPLAPRLSPEQFILQNLHFLTFFGISKCEEHDHYLLEQSLNEKNLLKKEMVRAIF
jgi:hypothetical protein